MHDHHDEEKKTEENLLVRSGKSRGLSATVELLVFSMLMHRPTQLLKQPINLRI